MEGTESTAVDGVVENAEGTVENEGTVETVETVETEQVDVEQLTADLTAKITAELEAKQEHEASLANLSEEDRAAALLDEREAAIAAREAEIALKEATAAASDELAKRSLPTMFASMLVGDSNQETLANIKTFEDSFNSEVNARVKGQLSQDAPNSSAQTGAAASKASKPFDAEAFARQMRR